MPDKFQYDVFLSYSAKDKTVVRPLAERLPKEGLKVWLDEWELSVAASRQSAANLSGEQANPEGIDGGALPRRRYAEKIEEGLEHWRAVPPRPSDGRGGKGEGGQWFRPGPGAVGKPDV